jgi:cyclic beta-1,2-glucan synthetase
MASAQQSPINFRLIVPLEDKADSVPLASQPVRSDKTVCEPGLRKPVAEVVRLWNIPRWTIVEKGTASEELESSWKATSKRIADLAEEFRKVIAEGNVLQGEARILSDNLSLIRVGLLESHAGIEAANKLPLVESESGAIPRAMALATTFLKSTGYVFDEESFTSFLAAAQRKVSLKISEVWNLKPFLEFVLLTQIAGPASDQITPETCTRGDVPPIEEPGKSLGPLVQSLKGLVNLEWKEFFERTAETESILRNDPQGSYEKMDFESREAYRAAVVDLAEQSLYSEQDVARKAVDLAQQAVNTDYSNERVKERRAHVGYYLTGAGRGALKKAISYRPAVLRRTRETLLKWSDFFYLIGIEVGSLAVMAIVLSASHVKPLSIMAAALFVLPAIECAVAIMNVLATRLFPPRKLPRLDFSNGIPEDCATVVAVPTLLTSEEQVRNAVHNLEIRFLANRDANLHFALLTDVPDSTQQFDDKDPLAGFCSGLIDQLNEKYGHEKKGAFFHFHRERVYNPSEELWMGWERKRGKLLDFNRFLLGQSDQFPVKAGDMPLLASVRYVITLDLDTQLPADAGHELVGTIAHPLNRPVVDPTSNTVVEGYGILQPRVDISIRSASRSRFASLLSGDTGVDLYSRAVSDVYQDLFGEGIFTGKGIYEVDTFHKVLEHRFPCNAVLSHDLIEGIYARTGLVSDIVVVDDYPSHFSAYSRRKHRWVRGDWQIIFGLRPRMRNFFGKMVRNPMSHISRWKIIDNLRRSLMDFATFLLFICAWLYLPGKPVYWTLAALALMAFPVYFQFAVSVGTAGKQLFSFGFWKNLLSDFAAAHSMVFFRLAFLCHQTLVTVDAVVRTLIRMKFTHKRLLQWETAADAEVGTGESLVDTYLRWTPILAAAIGVLIFAFRPGALRSALPILVLWASSNWICKWLNLPQRSGETRISADDRSLIRNMALRTWRFFREFSTPDQNWLIPDIVQQEPPIVAHRLSTTNLGLLLNSRQAAVDFGFLTTGEFAKETASTLEVVQRLPKFKGHLYNWYTTDTLEAVEPRFISTVDNGNLVCSLWTLKQGCLELRKQPIFRPVLWRGIHDIVDLLMELAAQSENPDVISSTTDLSQRVRELSGPELNRFEVIAALEIDATIYLEKVAERDANDDIAWWAQELSHRVSRLKVMVEDFAPWLLHEFQSKDFAKGIDGAILSKLTPESAPGAYARISAQLADVSETASLTEALERSKSVAGSLADQLTKLAEASDAMAAEMDFAFLYNPTKKQISIGYDGTEEKVSGYHYDLLASEARAAVFAAVAKGEMPQESWFELGRSYISYKGEDVLRSWTGTAFEYLMPCLWMRTYPNTLLERSSKAAIRAQQKFVAGQDIPWGISESSCNQRNPDGHYRYHAFGVPGVAINRDDCSGDVVIAPYATFLALPFDESAVKNLRKMKDLGWLSKYGFYEAADFTPRRLPEGKDHELVRNWMAHHQGMILVAVANALCDSAMLKRFHAEPRVAAHERLLHERYPRVVPTEKEAADAPESASKRLITLMSQAVLRPGPRNLAPKVS